MGRRRTGLWLALVAVLLLAGCGPFASPGSGPATCEPPARPASAVDGIYVLPDDGRDPVLHELDSAACAIDVSVYLISDDTIIDALLRAEKRGVRVRLIYEAAPFGGGVGIVEATEELTESGIELRTGPEDIRFMHAKYLVIDERTAIVTNQNLTYSAFESNREFGVVTTDPDDVATLAAIFEADWSESAPPVAGGRLIVSPQNSRPRLIELINDADREIRLYAEVIRDDEIVDALSSAAQRGVRVRIIVNEPDDDLDETIYTVLASNAIEIHVVGSPYIHAKALLIDDRAVVIGSQNPTATSLDSNREVSLLLDDPGALARVSSVFERDWVHGAPWIAGSSQF